MICRLVKVRPTDSGGVSSVWMARPGPLAGWLALVAFGALAAPTAASAHVRTGAVAVDYRAKASPLRSPLGAACAVRVYESDQALGLTVRRGHAVVVLGYSGEPFLRIDSAGVTVNAASPTAAAVGLLRHIRAPAGLAPAWQLESGGRTVIWHDVRVRGLPPDVQRREWAVPLVVDGRRVRLEGETWRVHAPSPWPWVGLAVPLIALAALLLARRRSLVRPAAAVFGAVAAAGTVATAATFALQGSASQGRWVEGGNELVFALVGLAVLARGSADARSIAGGALGLLALSVGLSKTPVFLHGVVLSAFPGTLTRNFGGGHDFGGRRRHGRWTGRFSRAARVAARTLGYTRSAVGTVIANCFGHASVCCRSEWGDRCATRSAAG